MEITLIILGTLYCLALLGAVGFLVYCNLKILGMLFQFAQLFNDVKKATQKQKIPDYIEDGFAQ